MKTILISLLTMMILVSLTTLASATGPKNSKRKYYPCNKIGQSKVHPYYKHKIRHFGLLTRKTESKLVIYYPKPKMYSAHIID